MSSRESRAGWMIMIPALMLAAWLVGVAIVALAGAGSSWPDQQLGWAESSSGRVREPDDPRRSHAGPARLDDPRLSSLRDAARVLAAVGRSPGGWSSTRSAWCPTCRRSSKRSPRGTSGISSRS